METIKQYKENGGNKMSKLFIPYIMGDLNFIHHLKH